MVWLKHHLLPTVLEAGSQIRIPAEPASGEGPLPDPSCCILLWPREKASFPVSSYQGIHPPTGPHTPRIYQRPCVPVPSCWGLGFQRMNVGDEGQKHLVHSRKANPHSQCYMACKAQGQNVNSALFVPAAPPPHLHIPLSSVRLSTGGRSRGLRKSS